MLKRTEISKLDDYFIDLGKRRDRGVFFYRINGYNQQIHDFICRYYEAARLNGVIIEGKLQNPDNNNLAYYGEIMGMSFQMDINFIRSSLGKWLPRMTVSQRENVAGSIYNTLSGLRAAGKNDNMLKNAYIKFMCWLYYKFERVVNQLGENQIPKILYEGTISNYELMLISILSNAGCDVVLLQYEGDEGYLKVDPQSKLSDKLELSGMEPFPEGYCMKTVREEIQQAFNNERLYGTRPSVKNCTNAWISGKGLEDFSTDVQSRGSDDRFFYNCFCRINGAQDKLSYANELYQFQQKIKGVNRRMVIVNETISVPTPTEIAQIKRKNYARQDQMILDLAANISYTANIELQRLMHQAFVDIVLAEAKKDAGNLNKLTNKAIYLLCWLKRYSKDLFSNWKMPDISCFVYMGGCKNENEAMFLSFLARLPIDVLILCPDLNTKCCLNDKLLYEVNYSESVSLKEFPEENSQVRMGTVAYHAERELDTLMYQDTGMYRNQQYGSADVITLQTMYEEIKILWDQELKYRPNFSTTDGVVHIPVIFAKVSGVKDGDVSQYWASVQELITEDTIVIKNVPYLSFTDENPIKPYATMFFKNGKLQRQKIKSHAEYPYGILREDVQDLMLDKLQDLIDQKLIKGIGENGTEYSVIAQILNLPKEIVRMIQKFDFTKKNPKLIYINTSEKVISIEDSMMIAFLNLIGFDILFFVPTGYQNVEKYFTKDIMEEHQIGEYKYDLQIPNLKGPSSNHTRPKWRDKIFKRGNKYGT